MAVIGAVFLMLSPGIKLKKYSLQEEKKALKSNISNQF